MALPGSRPTRPARAKAAYYSRNAGDFIEASLVSRALRFALSERQLTDHGFSPEAAKTLLGPVALDSVHIDRQGANQSNGLGAVFLPYLLLGAIYATVLIYGLYVMRSVIEEKSSRVVEVLLGSVTPMQLMAGKIIGVGAVGLTQIGIWAAAGGILGSGSLAMAHQVVGETMKDAHISTASLLLFPVFFILGYATYACLYAAIGALVNSDEEAQQLQFPVTLPLVLCMVFAAAIIRDPNTPLAFWLSMFPLTSPIIMYVRVAVSMPPAWQIASSIAISLASLYVLGVAHLAHLSDWHPHVRQASHAGGDSEVDTLCLMAVPPVPRRALLHLRSCLGQHALHLGAVAVCWIDLQQRLPGHDGALGIVLPVHFDHSYIE